MAVEDALGLVEAHVDEVLALDHDLGETVAWSTRRLQRVNFRRLIVQILN